MDRRAEILGVVDPATARGLEIGPLDKPIVRRERGQQIWYADHTDTASLKEHYAQHAMVYSDHVPEDILDVDFVLSDGPLLELTKDVAPFDYVVASHVIEHIPDLVAWFDELSSVLVDGGRVCLAIPDRRYCFDARRASTELADVVAAHLEQRTRPSPHAPSSTSRGTSPLWTGRPPGAATFPTTSSRMWPPCTGECGSTPSTARTTTTSTCGPSHRRTSRRSSTPSAPWS